MTKHNTSPLADKFQNSTVNSPMASFEAFEARNKNNKRRFLWLEFSLSLLLLMAIAVSVFGFGSITQPFNNLFASNSDSNPIEASNELKNTPIDYENDNAANENDVIPKTDETAEINENSSPLESFEDDNSLSSDEAAVQETSTSWSSEAPSKEKTFMSSEASAKGKNYYTMEGDNLVPITPEELASAGIQSVEASSGEDVSSLSGNTMYVMRDGQLVPITKDEYQSYNTDKVASLKHTAIGEFSDGTKPLETMHQVALEINNQPKKLNLKTISKDRLEDLDEVTKKRISVTGYLGATRAQNELALSADAGDYLHPDFVRIFNESVRPDYGVAANLEINIPLTRFLSVSTGFGYTKNQLAGDYKFNVDKMPVFDTSKTGKIIDFVELPEGFRDFDLGSAVQSYSFARIPISLNYNYDVGDYSFEAGIGTELAWLVNASGNVINAADISNSMQLKDIINKDYAAFNAHLSAYRRILPKFDIGLSAGYYQQANSLYSFEHYMVKNKNMNALILLRFRPLD